MEIIGLTVINKLSNKVRGKNCEFITTYKEDKIYKYAILYKNKKYELKIYSKEHECPSGYTNSKTAYIKYEIVEIFDTFTHIPKTKLMINNKHISELHNDLILLCDDDLCDDNCKTGMLVCPHKYGKNYTYKCINITDININRKELECSNKFINNCGDDLKMYDTYNNLILLINTKGDDEWYPCGYYKVNIDLFKATKRYDDKRHVYIFQGQSGIGKSHISHLLNDKIIFETDTYSKLPKKIKADIIVIGNKYSYTIEDIKSTLNLNKVRPVLVGFEYI